MIKMNKYILTAFLIWIVAGYGIGAPGDPDTTFGGTGKLRFGFKSGDDSANGAVTQPDGKLIVVGGTPNGDGDFLVMRYNADGSLDQSFGRGGIVMTNIGAGEDSANDVALQGDGRIVVVGTCTGNGTNPDVCVARYNADGSLDPQFGLGGKIITPVTTSWDQGRAVAVQSDGKIVVVGDSLSNNASADTLIIRYTTSGSPDTTFGPNHTGIIVRDISPNQHDTANDVAIQADGKIVVVGEGHASQSPDFIVIMRYTSEGDADSSWTFNGLGMYRFTDTGHYRANALMIQPDGKVVLAGVGDSKFIMVRFTTTGLFDNTFNGNGRIITSVGGVYDEATAIMFSGITVQKITVAGFSMNAQGERRFAIARYTLDGEPDPQFNGTGRVVRPIGPGDDDRVRAVAFQAGAVAVAGSSFNGSNTDVAVARFTSSGMADNTFDTDGSRIDDPGFRNAFGRGVLVQPDGKIVVAGTSGTDLTGTDFSIARYNPNGTLDMGFADNGRWTTDFGALQEEGTSVALAPDGKIVVAGYRIDPAANTADFAIARYNPNGTPDPTFDGEGELVMPIGPGNDLARGVAVQADGKIIVAGSTDIGGGATDFAVVRLNVNGTPDGTFGSGGKAVTAVGLGNDEAMAVVVQPDGKIVAGGNAYNGSMSDFALVRYTTGGIPDNQFGSFGRQITPVGTNTDVCSGMTLMPNGKIVLAGYSAGPTGNTAQFAAVRYGTNGMPDASFDQDGIVTTPVGLTVAIATSVAGMADGRIVVSGAAVLGSAIDIASVRYLDNGALDGSYGVAGKSVVDVSGESDIGWATAVDALGRTLIAGESKGLFGLIRLQGDFAPRKTPFDFDGDSKTDLSIYRPSVGQWWLQKSSDNSAYVAQFGNATDKLAAADFTGDGKTDVAVFRPSDGHWYVLRSDNSSFYAFPFGTEGDVPMPADYDGDGKADAAVYRPSTSTWFIQRSTDFGVTITQFGINGDQPVTADYDGDGKADIAIRRPSNGQWWLNRSTAGVIAVTFGTGSDNAVQGDFTGDGKADVAVWRPTTGFWFVLRSEDFSFYAFPFGTTGDIPSPGDYDGDGKSDATVFRPNGSVWFVNKTSGGVLIQQFGAAGDQPVPNAFVR
jgi:uncharacterized delta-60 repeat protein